MDSKFADYVISEKEYMVEALKKINKNTQGFVIVIGDNDVVLGVLTDGDVRRAIIQNNDTIKLVAEIYTRNAKIVKISDGFDVVIDIFKNQAIKFLPIVDENGCLINIITKNHMYALFLQDIHADLTYDFLSLDTSVIDHEIYQRPWGHYKTTVLNDYFQGKIISIKPGGQLSLQSHNHREEHWIVVHGNGIVQLDNSFLDVSCGRSVFIPKGCKHRLTNTDKNENLIITEVQIGDYFGEDDIFRYEDAYGRI